MFLVILCTLVSCAILLYTYTILSNGQFNSNQTMVGKTVIITGSNTGIGKETARELAARGAKVILACRTPEKGQKAAEQIVTSTGNEKVYFRQLDLCSFTSVRKFVKQFTESEDRLDVLINNAGTLPRKAPEGTHQTEDGLEVGWQSNHFGHFLLTMLLVPKLKKSAPSRIINVSSVGHRAALSINSEQFQGDCECSPWSVYLQTKLANVLFTRSLASRLDGSGVTANSLHPGVITSGIFQHLDGWQRRFIELICAPFMKSVKQGAQTTIYLAVDRKLEKISGEYFADCKLSRASKRAEDARLGEELWVASEELSGYNKWTVDGML